HILPRLYVVVSVTRLVAPAPALFPYTTLFRSRCDAERGARRLRHPRRAHRERVARSRLVDAEPRERRHAARRGHSGGAGKRAPTDRKSTRLNSSHDQTSYAVFCLTKKNIRSRS